MEHALKVLRDACAELIAAVESGELAVTPAASLAGLPVEEQAKVVAGGATEIAVKVRELAVRRPRPGRRCGRSVFCIRSRRWRLEPARLATSR